MEKNEIKNNKSSAPIIIRAEKRVRHENENKHTGGLFRDGIDTRNNFQNDEKMEENTGKDAILANNNDKSRTINAKKIGKNNYGKEIISIENDPMKSTGNGNTGPHVVKIRVNPSRMTCNSPPSSSSSLSLAPTTTTTTTSTTTSTVSTRPVRLASFSSFPMEERGPTAMIAASRPAAESRTDAADNQSSTNTVRINIGTETKVASSRELPVSRNMVPSPLPPNNSYYYTSSTYEDNGQTSPASDSGTCSDLDSSNTSSPVPKIKKEKSSASSNNNNNNNNRVKLPITQTTKVTITSAITKNPSVRHENNHTVLINHRRGSSLTSSGADVEESDDDVSCDSLNSGELELINDNDGKNHDDNKTKIIELTRKILQNNRDKNVSVAAEYFEEAKDAKTVLDGDANDGGTITPVVEQRTYEDRLRVVNNRERSTPSTKTSENNSVNSLKSNRIDKNKSSVRITADGNHGSLNNNGYKSNSDSENFDCFYNFHLNENNFDSDGNKNKSDGARDSKIILKNGDSFNDDMADYFAGCKNYNESCDPETSTIRSSKGTIRGVKNRVRAGIATFLQIHATKSWQEKEAGKVVVYTTTMGIVRETYQRCLKVRKILRTHLVKFDEKDVFMSREVQTEIRERMGSDNISLPQVFVEGHHIGDAETIDRLNESGELRRILKPYKSPDACTTCKVCGGYRLLPCPVCNGSKKSVHRNHFTTELVALKCMNCDEVGLIRCYNC